MNSLFESFNDIDSLVTEFSGVLVRVSRNVAKIKNGHTPKKKQKIQSRNKNGLTQAVTY